MYASLHIYYTQALKISDIESGILRVRKISKGDDDIQHKTTEYHHYINKNKIALLKPSV